jgi:ketosteroid isomerase-like protein
MKTAFALLPLLVVLIVGSPVEAKSNAPDATAFVRDFYAAYHAKDAVKLAEFYAADATLVDPSFELDLKGRDAIRDLLTKALVKYKTVDWEISNTIKAGDDLVVEGTMIGQLPQKTVRVPFVSIFHFKDRKISAQRDMFDMLHYFLQLGARMINREEEGTKQ